MVQKYKEESRAKKQESRQKSAGEIVLTAKVNLGS